MPDDPDIQSYSTFDRYVDVGLYPNGWAGKVPDLQIVELKQSEARGGRRCAFPPYALKLNRNRSPLYLNKCVKGALAEPHMQ
jgi:hypothetical protein